MYGDCFDNVFILLMLGSRDNIIVCLGINIKHLFIMKVPQYYMYLNMLLTPYLDNHYNLLLTLKWMSNYYYKICKRGGGLKNRS